MKFKKLLTALLLCCSFLQVSSQAADNGEKDKSAKIKAVFIYNFTKYTSWPKGTKDESFKLGIYNNEQLYIELSKMAAVKKVANQVFEVVKIEKLSDVDASFEMIYLNDKKKISLKEMYLSIGKNPILVVTDAYNENDVMIDFRVEGVRQKFALNKAQLEQQGLQVNPVLENLAIPIKNNYTYVRSITKPTGQVAVNEPKVESKSANENTEKVTQEAPTISNEKYDEIIAQMQAELETDKKALKNKDKEISTLKSSISELETTILLKENQLNILKQQIELKSKKLSEISDSTIQKAKELQINIEKSKKALGNLQEIKAELVDSKAILASQKAINTVTIIVLIIIAILGAIAFKNYRTQKKQGNIIREQKTVAESQRDEIQTQHLQLEEKNREITDSITYAKRIQEAILPPLKLVQSNLENSFIFYQPKDIVAGDFYWMEPQTEQVIFAAADCTGHGVPGAMVSVVCSNALNRAVREFNLTEPAKILDKTLEIVIERFEKSEEEVKDGMDIALCSYQASSKLLNYAGAHNPLWIIRKGSSEVEEIKADKQPIGKYAEQKPFTNHKINLNEGDTVYIFSDGYVDQFGGERGKKFKTVNFKKLLLSIQDKDITEQYAIIKQNFSDWKADIEQLDDVCVIGFRA